MKLLAPILKAQPDFFIIGAMKSGTTSLYQYLNFHSRVESSLVKEPCYYSYNFGKGKSWYLNQFPAKKWLAPKTWYFDASPVYLHDAQSPARMYADYPKAKLIVICRDPIERSLSHYNYYSSKDSNFGKKPENKIDQRSVAQAFDDDMNGLETRPFFRYCHMSCYAEQIAHFLAKYSREQVMFVDLHDLETNVIDSLLEIAAFLGLPSADEFRHIAVSNDKVDSQQSFEKTDDKQFKRFNSLEYSIPMSEELEARLKQFFRRDVEQLQAISGRKFSWANKYLN